MECSGMQGAAALIHLGDNSVIKEGEKKASSSLQCVIFLGGFFAVSTLIKTMFE